MDHADSEDLAWCLGRESWTFRRWFFEVYGRPMQKGEYTRLLRQMFKSHKPELIVAGVYQLRVHDGSPIMVTGYSGHQPQLYSALLPEWQIGDQVPWQRDPPRVRHAVRPKPTPAQAPPILVAQLAPAAAPPTAEAPLRKATPLSLDGQNSDVAATLLEYRKCVGFHLHTTGAN